MIEVLLDFVDGVLAIGLSLQDADHFFRHVTVFLLAEIEVAPLIREQNVLVIKPVIAAPLRRL
jgi:hypothetical protein